MFAFIAFLIGLNLRPILASIGPLFPVLQREAGLSATEFSLLTTLPVAMMGLVALSGPWLLARTGAVRGITVGLSILLFACLFRGFSTSLTGLMCTALAGGASIGMIQALMPALIKKNTRNRPARLCLCSAPELWPVRRWLLPRPSRCLPGLI
jgi:CP family cyanate transporter-like MFS transporter